LVREPSALAYGLVLPLAVYVIGQNRRRCGFVAELHGFLSYLVKVAVQGQPYTVFGYKGKQVRDQIHSIDVILAFDAFARNPRRGEPYNLGGGQNSASVLECIAARWYNIRVT
jgi:nucleoside-diphosphate-sugar epimerase